MDRAILGLLYKGGRPLTGNEISKAIGLKPPSTIKRLKKLKSQGCIKPYKIGKIRRYQKIIKGIPRRIAIPSKVWWIIDIKK